MNQKKKDPQKRWQIAFWILLCLILLTGFQNIPDQAIILKRHFSEWLGYITVPILLISVPYYYGFAKDVKKTQVLPLVAFTIGIVLYTIPSILLVLLVKQFRQKHPSPYLHFLPKQTVNPKVCLNMERYFRRFFPVPII